MQFKTQLERLYFERYVLDVAIATLEQGMTASKLDTYQFLSPVDAWGFPKYPGRTVILPPDADLLEELAKFIEANETYLSEPDCWLGTWVNPHTEHCYLDITTSCKDLEEARKMALDLGAKEGRRIVAIYNSKLDQTVYLEKIMKFQIVDTERAYRQLLTAPDAAVRETIFREELIAPFSGLVQFFGGDGMAAFAGWGMSPDQFAGNKREQMTAIIETLAAHDAWNKAAQALEDGRAAFARHANRIPLDSIVFGLYVADMSSVPLQRGYTGFGGIPGWIMTVYGVPDEYNLHRIKAATAHELHHNVRGSVLPGNMMTATVGEYMIGEGLAESFAAELYGEDRIGFWATDFDESRLEEARQVIGGALNVTGFNAIRGYIFGDILAEHMGLPKAGVPAFAGYAIGYRVVQAYLKRTGKDVVEATFVSPLDIIAESEFFD